MSCYECGGKLKGWVSKPGRPYRYTFSGLSNVLLYGVTVYRCVDCGSGSTEFPRLGELLRVIADAVSRKPGRLRGEEVRYLRKHMGVSATEFARAAGIALATLSRAENGKGRIPIPAEQLLRVMAREAARSESAGERIRALARLGLGDLRGRSDSDRPSRPRRFRHVAGKGWKQAA